MTYVMRCEQIVREERKNPVASLITIIKRRWFDREKNTEIYYLNHRTKKEKHKQRKNEEK